MSTDVLEEINDADTAYLSSLTPKVLNGTELEPFSLIRQTVAMELVGSDPSAFFDAVIRVWICTLKPIEVVKARLNKDASILTAFEWAEKQGFSFSNWKPLLDLYKRINEEINQAIDVVQEGTDQTPKDNGVQQAS